MPDLLDALERKIHRENALPVLVDRLEADLADLAVASSAIGPVVLGGMLGLAEASGSDQPLTELVETAPYEDASKAIEDLAGVSSAVGNEILDRLFRAHRGQAMVAAAAEVDVETHLVGRLAPFLAPVVLAELKQRWRSKELTEEQLLALIRSELGDAAAGPISSAASLSSPPVASTAESKVEASALVDIDSQVGSAPTDSSEVRPAPSPSAPTLQPPSLLSPSDLNSVPSADGSAPAAEVPASVATLMGLPRTGDVKSAPAAPARPEPTGPRVVKVGGGQGAVSAEELPQLGGGRSEPNGTKDASDSADGVFGSSTENRMAFDVADDRFDPSLGGQQFLRMLVSGDLGAYLWWVLGGVAVLLILVLLFAF